MKVGFIQVLWSNVVKFWSKYWPCDPSNASTWRCIASIMRNSVLKSSQIVIDNLIMGFNSASPWEQARPSNKIKNWKSNDTSLQEHVPGGQASFQYHPSRTRGRTKWGRGGGQNSITCTALPLLGSLSPRSKWHRYLFTRVAPPSCLLQPMSGAGQCSTTNEKADGCHGNNIFPSPLVHREHHSIASVLGETASQRNRLVQQGRISCYLLTAPQSCFRLFLYGASNRDYWI